MRSQKIGNEAAKDWEASHRQMLKTSCGKWADYLNEIIRRYKDGGG